MSKGCRMQLKLFNFQMAYFKSTFKASLHGAFKSTSDGNIFLSKDLLDTEPLSCNSFKKEPESSPSDQSNFSLHTF